MNKIEFGEVVNGEETYKEIAGEIKDGSHCIFGWTDENGTHFDILMSTSPIYLGGTLQGGIMPSRDLFVSIMRMGAFGFEINENEKYPSYVNEKFMNKLGCSAEQVAELINNVIKELL